MISSGRRISVAVSGAIDLPSRRTASLTRSPGPVFSSTSISSSEISIADSSTFVMTSRTFRPAAAAGVPGPTIRTRQPPSGASAAAKCPRYPLEDCMSRNRGLFNSSRIMAAPRLVNEISMRAGLSGSIEPSVTNFCAAAGAPAAARSAPSTAPSTAPWSAGTGFAPASGSPSVVAPSAALALPFGSPASTAAPPLPALSAVPSVSASSP